MDLSVASTDPRSDLADSRSPTTPAYRFGVDQYYAMSSAGILRPDDRVELLEGLVVQKMTKHQPHVIAVNLLSEILTRRLPENWYLDREAPLELVDSVPEPDLMIVRGSPRDYPTRPPKASDVALVVEVADSSLERDRVLKKRAYARSAAREFWLMDLVHGLIEIHRSPIEVAEYSTCDRYFAQDLITLELEGVRIVEFKVGDALP